MDIRDYIKFLDRNPGLSVHLKEIETNIRRVFGREPDIKVSFDEEDFRVWVNIITELPYKESKILMEDLKEWWYQYLYDNKCDISIQIGD